VRLARQLDTSDVIARIEARPSSTIDPPSLGLSADAKPVRKFARQRLRHTYRGFSASQKIVSREMAICESTLERDQHTLLSADPNIIKFAVQPHWLSFWTVDRQGCRVLRRYAPDIIAEMRGGHRVVIEVKSQTFADTDKWRVRERDIRSAYAEHGLDFVVFTEREIRNEPRLSNCKQMLRHRGFGQDARHTLLVRRAISVANSPSTVSAILGGVAQMGGEVDPAFSVLMQFALSGEVIIDLSSALGDASVVEWS
jgi:hypothetical protein